MVKNLHAKWETKVRSLGWEDSLEKGTATHFGKSSEQCTKFSYEQYTICERNNFSYNPQICFNIHNMSSTVLDSDDTKMIHICARVFDQKGKIWLSQAPPHTASPTQRIGLLFFLQNFGEK